MLELLSNAETGEGRFHFIDCFGVVFDELVNVFKSIRMILLFQRQIGYFFVHLLKVHIYS